MEEKGIQFAAFIRSRIEAQHLDEEAVLKTAQVPDDRGRGILSGAVITTVRDELTRICLGAHLSFEELQQVLALYDMPQIDPVINRDSLIASSFHAGIYDVSMVNMLMERYDLEPLR